MTGFLVLNNPVNSELLTINPSALLQEGTADQFRILERQLGASSLVSVKK